LNEGFLGTGASLAADSALLLEIAMGVGLLIGGWLARKGHYRQHARCQAGILLINLVVIGLVMLPAFRGQVIPRIPSKLDRSYYALATAHATLGAMAECLGLYIALAAGTKLLPERLRIKRYKLWMRTAVAAWWLVLLLGATTYVRWYVPQIFRK